ISSCPRVKNYDSLDRVCFVQSRDTLSFLKVSWIAPRRGDHANRGVRTPIDRLRTDLTAGDGFANLNQITVKPDKHGLSFGITETCIELNYLWPIVGEHQSRI